MPTSASARACRWPARSADAGAGARAAGHARHAGPGGAVPAAVRARGRRLDRRPSTRPRCSALAADPGAAPREDWRATLLDAITILVSAVHAAGYCAGAAPAHGRRRCCRTNPSASSRCRPARCASAVLRGPPRRGAAGGRLPARAARRLPARRRPASRRTWSSSASRWTSSSTSTSCRAARGASSSCWSACWRPTRRRSGGGCWPTLVREIAERARRARAAGAPLFAAGAQGRRAQRRDRRALHHAHPRRIPRHAAPRRRRRRGPRRHHLRQVRRRGHRPVGLLDRLLVRRQLRRQLRRRHAAALDGGHQAAGDDGAGAGGARCRRPAAAPATSRSRPSSTAWRSSSARRPPASSATWRCARRWCWRRSGWPRALFGAPLVGAEDAEHVLHSLTLLGPTALYRRLHRRAAVRQFADRRLGRELVRPAPPGQRHRLEPAHRGARWARRARGAGRTGARANVSGAGGQCLAGHDAGRWRRRCWTSWARRWRCGTSRLSSGQLGAALGALGWPLLRRAGVLVVRGRHRRHRRAERDGELLAGLQGGAALRAACA